LLSCVVWLSACDDNPQVKFLRSETYTFASSERLLIEQITRATIKEVRALLPGLPESIQLTVRPGTAVIPETGEVADAMPPDAIMWTVDPGQHGGVSAITRQWLRAMLFHELHHLARYPAGHPQSIVDRAVFEGMATAFERDFAAVRPPWGAYPENVEAWANELLALPPDAPAQDWMFRHPDGRRWIGYRVGTHWVDQASNKSGRSSRDLVTTPARQVLELAR
jgi:uncharacterized protein YjaZ